MTTAANKYVPAKTHRRLTPGDAVRVVRELQELTQADLAKRAAMTQATISALEKGHTALGADRAKRLAVALRVHPSVLLFPNWDEEAKEVARKLRRAAG